MADIFMHGVYTEENPTSITPPVNVASAVQVAIGVAPVSEELENPLSPQIAFDYKEAVNKMGMANDIMAFTLCQVTKASFELHNVAPVIYINVLDPTLHKKQVTDEVMTFYEGNATIEQDGVMLSTLVIKDNTGATTYELGKDYTVKFGASNYPVISIAKDSTINKNAACTIEYSKYDPSLVTDNDVLAGIEKIWEVYPKFQVVPCSIIAPGFSQKPEINLALTAATQNINSTFKAFAFIDLDTNTADMYDKVQDVKNSGNFTSEFTDVLWPCVKVGNDVYYRSAIEAAHMAKVDYENGGIPNVSPSNKRLNISGICLADGTEVVIDHTRANFLNGQGINTAINYNGWKSWGNSTAAFPGTTDPKDRFIAIRRFFNWWSNTFILTYFQKIDEPMNLRLVENIIDSENIRANGFIAQGIVAKASISLDPSLTESDVANGKLKFLQKLSPYTPAEVIVNTLEFDVNALFNSITGGDA